MINSSRGTPFVGYASLTSTTTSVQFSLFVGMGQSAYTMQPGDRLYIDQIQISTSDTTQRLVTVDTLGPTPTKLASAYVVSTQPPFTESIAPGMCASAIGIVPRAFAPAVTAGKTVEVVIVGHIALDSPNATTAPQNLTGLGLWLNADAAGNYASGTWTDLSGNGLSPSQATAGQRPAFAAGGGPTATTNALTLASASSQYLFEATAAPVSVTNCTIFSVQKITTGASFKCVYDVGAGASDGMMVATNAANRVLNMNGVATVTDSAYTSGTWEKWTVQNNGTSLVLRVNGTQVLSTASSSVAAGNGFSMGSQTTAGALFLDGSVSEILAYKRVLSAAEIAAIETYLFNKYGL